MNVTVFGLLRDLCARGYDVPLRAGWPNVRQRVKRSGRASKEHDARPVASPTRHRVGVGDDELDHPILRRNNRRSRPSDAIDPRVPAGAVRALRKPRAAPGNRRGHGGGHPSRHAGQPADVRAGRMLIDQRHDVEPRAGST